MSTGYLNNKKKIELNPFDGSLEINPDIAAGTTTRNNTIVSYTIQAGFTRVHPNLGIPVGIQVDVEVGGELIVL